MKYCKPRISEVKPDMSKITDTIEVIWLLTDRDRYECAVLEKKSELQSPFVHLGAVEWDYAGA